ncbi:UbiX family flavin prenyltransferase [Diplocloster modestus]|uniref:Flavin prenyltransferase UbiX n=1 Tax=Diplocloster modestus TaxID=2850322 RepID=A0ABS6KEK2_9FIRM|nr:UbiX family flavin prenyltransferase [Diplocloster modestus]MBU9728904.1 UbiX family flavin prenyltransferase [Diplocloster modestus]
MIKIILGITGASGVELGLHILRALKRQNAEIHLIISEGARYTMREESNLTEEEFLRIADYVYGEKELGAAIASGSFVTDGMIVAPCSMKTLSGIANAYDENLIIRAADVCLKEGRKVVLLPREMPLGRAHLKNMLACAENGCSIIPPMLSFYMEDTSVKAQLDHITGKVLMQFGMTYEKFHSWQGPDRRETTQ